MAQLIFDQAGYLVKSGTDTIVLLAKEYALLEFLYYNRNHTFTREQLLDRVWMLEYPSERTVDDHIYRLRKKLHHWDHITINTVRGYGYTLTLNERRQVDNPSVHDEEMKNAIGEMFEKYHRFGQSKSMLALETQQDVLGFEMDPFYQVYLRFIQGDIPWFLERRKYHSKSGYIGCYFYIGECHLTPMMCCGSVNWHWIRVSCRQSNIEKWRY